MKKKTIYIGLGLVALAGSVYFYMKNNPTKPTVNNLGTNCPNANETKDASGNCIKTGGSRGGVQSNKPTCAADEHLEDISIQCFMAPCPSIPTCVKNKAGFTGFKKKNYINSHF